MELSRYLYIKGRIYRVNQRFDRLAVSLFITELPDILVPVENFGNVNKSIEKLFSIVKSRIEGMDEPPQPTDFYF